MTIFTSNQNDKKEDEDFIPPEVVDYVKTPPVLVKVNNNGGVGVVRRRRVGSMHVCLALIILPLGLCLLTGCIWLYKRLNERAYFDDSRYYGRCGVNFHQLRHFDPFLPRQGHFESTFEVTKVYEVISFPQFGKVSQSRTVHDFQKNITLVADEARGVCYIRPLNRSHVFMPMNFWQALKGIEQMKLDAEVSMENYHILTPSLTQEEKEQEGGLLMKYCSEKDTYRMLPESKKKRKPQPKKRSACGLKGVHYCESATQEHNLFCFTISNCL